MPASQAEAQRLANAAYYSSKGKAIYSDFSTFAQGRALATCNAIEFVRDFSHYSEIIVCEYGVGNGKFARVFLDEVLKRDRNLYGCISYFLFDLSQKMLADAKKTLKAHFPTCTFSAFDAAYDIPAQEFDYCRINELLTDLPAEIYMIKGGKITSLDGKHTTSDIFVSKFLQRVDVGRAIPFNFAAQHFLLGLCKIGRQNFRIDLFDYGFYSAGGIFTHPQEEWNSLMAREYGSQITHNVRHGAIGKRGSAEGCTPHNVTHNVRHGAIGKRGSAEGCTPHNVTVDLNFPQLLSSLASQGIPAKIEPQKDYAEKILGIPLQLSQTKSRLDYIKRKSAEFDEDDGFYHLRAGR